MKHHKEKHLQATIYKIENVKRERKFLLRNKWKVILFGIAFSFWAPTYAPRSNFHHAKSLASKGEYSYIQLAIISAIVFIVLCFLFHLSSEYQHKKKLKNLTELKIELEKELQAYK